MKIKITVLFALLGILTLFTNCTTGGSSLQQQYVEQATRITPPTAIA